MLEVEPLPPFMVTPPCLELKESLVDPKQQEPKEIPPDAAPVGNGKRLRKRKIAPDMLSSDDNAVRHASSGLHHNRIRNNSSDQRRRRPSKPPNKVMVNQTGDSLKKQTEGAVIKSPPVSMFGSKLLTSTSQQTVSTSQQTAPLETSEVYTPPVKRVKKTKSVDKVVDKLNSMHLSNGHHHTTENLTSSEAKPVMMNSQRHMESHLTQLGKLSTPCLICSKRFRNEANMRKHLRFHSGRNFPCKHGCNLVYHNVARLVKHLRNCHPELPTRSQLGIIAVLNKSAGRPLKGKGRRPLAETKKKCGVRAGGSSQVQRKKTEKGRPTKKRTEKASKKTTRKKGTRKPLSSRRRKEATRSSIQRLPVQCTTPSYYKNVSENISNNLLHYVDGGYDSLRTARQYIRWDDDEEAENSQPEDFDWTRYGFPPNFNGEYSLVPHEAHTPTDQMEVLPGTKDS